MAKRRRNNKEPREGPSTKSLEAGDSAKDDDDPSKWSKSKRKRMRTLKSKLKKQDNSSNVRPQMSANDDGEKPDKTVDSAKSTLQDSFKARLSGSRFRILNEELYTTTSSESFQRFSSNPELYDQYHDGFRHQVESWPVNPVDVIVRWASNKYRTKSCVVADFGCGDAQLAKDLLKVKSSKTDEPAFKVHSFDLVSRNELVTACDMSNVPLEDKSVDVCVFCLSLMGTNLADFIREAHRVLKDNGRMKIAEVRSRIEYSHAAAGKQSKKAKKKDDDDSEKSSGTVKEFTDMLDKLGFDCVKADQSNKMFLLLECVKNKKKPDSKLTFTAKPCIYKRR